MGAEHRNPGGCPIVICAAPFTRTGEHMLTVDDTVACARKQVFWKREMDPHTGSGRSESDRQVCATHPAAMTVHLGAGRAARERGATVLDQHLLGAPTGTRTQTGRILSPDRGASATRRNGLAQGIKSPLRQWFSSLPVRLPYA